MRLKGGKFLITLPTQLNNANDDIIGELPKELVSLISTYIIKGRQIFKSDIMTSLKDFEIVFKDENDFIVKSNVNIRLADDNSELMLNVLLLSPDTLDSYNFNIFIGADDILKSIYSHHSYSL